MLNACRALLIGTLLWCSTGAAASTDWDEIHHKQGIRVWQHKIAGKPFLEFLAEARIDAHIRDVFAVIFDDERRPDWMVRLAHHRVIKRFTGTHSLIYSQMVSGFPLVSDRDVVVDASSTFFPEKRQVLIDFHSVKYEPVPPVDGLVRVPEMSGIFRLTATDEGTTEVTYKVYADPGGWVPAWVVNVIADELPLWTLVNMRKLVGTPEFQDMSERLGAMFDWKPYESTEQAALEEDSTATP